MTPEEVDRLVEHARSETRDRVASAEQNFGLGRWKRYDVDLTAASIAFSDAEGRIRIRASVEVAGTWSDGSASWLWPWDNQSLPEQVRRRMGLVKQFGQDNDLPHLVDPVQPCDEGLAWTLASVACHLLAADCPYRVPGSRGQTFLLLFDLREVP